LSFRNKVDIPNGTNWARLWPRFFAGGEARLESRTADAYSREILSDYTEEHAQAGIDAPLPAVETWPNQFKGYRITTEIPEFTSICPKTGLPDFGKLTIEYEPDELCIELKSLKHYALAYRNLGIFYENLVNRVLRDLVEATKPVRMKVTGEFTPRGGILSTVAAEYRQLAEAENWPR